MTVKRYLILIYLIQPTSIFVFIFPRTEMLGCENDADFRVKVYCIRNAFNVITCFVLLEFQFLRYLTNIILIYDFAPLNHKITDEPPRDSLMSQQTKSLSVLCSHVFSLEFQMFLDHPVFQ